MTDSPASRPPRDSGAEPQSISGSFRSWLRAALRGKSEASWRETIEELIEENGEAEADPEAVAGHERMLLGNILRLRDLTAYDVMVPRADIVAIEVDTPLAEALSLLARKAHSRVPVYRETLDDILGIVHIKDVMPYIADRLSREGDGGAESRILHDFLRDVLIIAPSMRVLDLLLEMRQKGQHMALVVDEFGGIDGLITIEDMIEEIVGEIADEHESQAAPQLIERPDGTFLADARLPITDFEARFGAVLDDDERDDIDTLGGLVYSLAGRIPARGELLRHPAGFEFEVAEADPRRIGRLRVRLVEAAPKQDG
ncbi:MAG: HlyC/CorC family transporter [Rhodospirillaceae bacterium]|nr:HlyC/CorC family transporter [Rhodospirillaceae bacterium]